MTVPTLIGFSGSLRRGSFNSALLRAAAELSPKSIRFEQASIAGIPLYNADDENESGVPEPVRLLKDRIASSAGLLIVTPEYNNSIPGVLKNAIDWLTRPSADVRRVFAGRPTAIIGASPGRFGTTLSQTAWLPVLRSLGVRPWFGGRLLVASASKVFSESGELTDERVRGELEEFMKGFVDFALGGEG